MADPARIYSDVIRGAPRAQERFTRICMAAIRDLSDVLVLSLSTKYLTFRIAAPKLSAIVRIFLPLSRCVGSSISASSEEKNWTRGRARRESREKERAPCGNTISIFIIITND